MSISVCFEPTKIWEVKFKSNSKKLEKPIIFPVDSDWNIELEYQTSQRDLPFNK